MLPWEQSPIAKIDLIYQALKFTLASEVDSFWEDTERFLSTSERNIDIDNLQGLTIYIVWALKNPSILTDCLITSEFLSKGTKLSTRTLFLEMLKNSIEFLLDFQVDQNPQETPEDSNRPSMDPFLQTQRTTDNNVAENFITKSQRLSVINNIEEMRQS